MHISSFLGICWPGLRSSWKRALGKIVLKKVNWAGSASLSSQMELHCWDWPELQPLLGHNQALTYRIMLSALPCPQRNSQCPGLGLSQFSLAALFPSWVSEIGPGCQSLSWYPLGNLWCLQAATCCTFRHLQCSLQLTSIHLAAGKWVKQTTKFLTSCFLFCEVFINYSRKAPYGQGSPRQKNLKVSS